MHLYMIQLFKGKKSPTLIFPLKHKTIGSRSADDIYLKVSLSGCVKKVLKTNITYKSLFFFFNIKMVKIFSQPIRLTPPPLPAKEKRMPY